MKVYFTAAIKLDRYYEIQSHLKKSGVDLFIERRNRSILKTLARLFRQDSRTIFMTNDWLSLPICFYITYLIKGNRYVLILNSALWDAWDDYGFSRARKKLYFFVLRAVLRRSAAIICNSHFLSNELSKNFPELTQKISPIYNGVKSSTPKSSDLFPYPDKRISVLTITTLEQREKYKGFTLLLESLQKNNHLVDNIIILAKVYSKRGWKNYRELQELAIKDYPDLKIQIHANANVYKYFNPDKAIFVYCSFRDSLPRAILEAQAAGMPSVIVDTNGCAEAVMEGESALVVPPESQSISEAIFTLVQSSELRNRMKANAPDFINSRFSWARMAEGYEAVLRNVSNNI